MPTQRYKRFRKALRIGGENTDYRKDFIQAIRELEEDWCYWTDLEDELDLVYPEWKDYSESELLLLCEKPSFYRYLQAAWYMNIHDYQRSLIVNLNEDIEVKWKISRGEIFAQSEALIARIVKKTEEGPWLLYLQQHTCYLLLNASNLEEACREATQHCFKGQFHV